MRWGNWTLDEATITVLLVEDDADEVLLLEEAMRAAEANDIALIPVDRLEAALRILGERNVDAVLLDLSLPDSSGIEGVEAILPLAGEAPVMVCTGLNDDAIAQEAIRVGAHDYLVKNPKLYGAVPRILRYTVERSRLVHAANRRVEQARKYTEMLLTKVISVVDAGLAITDESGKFLVVNPVMAELCGDSCNNLLGRTWTDILAEEQRAPELAAYRRSMSGEDSYERERIEICPSTGGKVAVSLRSVIVKISDDNVCRVLSFGKQSIRGGTGPNDFAEQLKGRVGAAPARLAAGRIQTIGLQNVRATLGDRWDAISARVYEIGERCVAKHLSPQDAFMRNESGDFIICFAQLTETEAWQKAQAISRDIHKKILGDAADDLFADCALSPDLRDSIANLESDANPIQLTPDELKNPTQLAELVTDKIKASAVRVKANTEAMLADLHRSCKARLREVQKRDRKVATLMVHELDPDDRARAERLICTTGDCPEMTSEVDFIVLGSAAQRIHELAAGKIPLIAVEVNYSTLDDPALCKRYLSICRSLDRRVSSSLVFRVKGVPPDTHTSRVGWVAATLRPHARLCMLQLTKPSLGALDLRDAEIAVIAIDYADLMSAFIRDRDRAKDFIRQAHAFGSRVLVDRVNSVNGNHLFRDLNVDFISYDLETALVA